MNKNLIDRIVWVIVVITCIVIMMIGLSGCYRTNPGTPAGPVIDGTFNNGKPSIYVNEFGYNGHDYIEFKVLEPNGEWSSVVIHNPDCHCFKDSINNNK